MKHFWDGIEDKVDEVNATIQKFLSLKPGRSLQTKLVLQAVCITVLGEPGKPRDVLHRAWQPFLTLPNHPPKIETIPLEELYEKSTKATKVLQVLFGKIYDQSITVQEVKEVKPYEDILRQFHDSVGNNSKDIIKLFAQVEHTIADFEEKLKQVSSFVYEWYKPIATSTEYGVVHNNLANVLNYDHMPVSILSITVRIELLDREAADIVLESTRHSETAPGQSNKKPVRVQRFSSDKDNMGTFYFEVRANTMTCK